MKDFMFRVNLSGTILPLVTMLYDLAYFMVDVITLLWYYNCPKIINLVIWLNRCGLVNF